MAKAARAPEKAESVAPAIRNRIKELRNVRAGDLIPNPENWRRHPEKQRRALRGLLKELGYVDALIAREDASGGLVLLDGHLRAATTPESVVPVLVLDVTEDEGRKILATLDPLAAMAESDDAALRTLTAKVKTGDRDLATLMHLVHDENIGIDLAAQGGGPLIQDARAELVERGSDPQPLASAPGVQPDTALGEFDKVPSKLPGQLQLTDRLVYKANHEMGWPDLRLDMLVERLPTPMDTWGDHLNTPDDGVTTWLYNYGTVPSQGMPFDRAILSFFSWDQKFENWWQVPSFYVTKMLNSGLRTAIMPDFSLWIAEPKALHLFNVFRNLWLARYFQEAGIKVIPKVNASSEEMWDYCWSGVPDPCPVLAMQLQTQGKPEEHPPEGIVESFREILRRFHPGQMLIYGGARAQAIVDVVAPSCEVVVLDTAANKRGRKQREARGAL